MKLKIEDDEQQEAAVSTLSGALTLLKENFDIGYIVVHNGDGTCYKAGVNETDGLWIARFTDDDPVVK